MQLPAGGCRLLRRVLRIVAWVVLGVLLFVATCLLAAAIWLRTYSGHRFVCRQIEQRAGKVIAGTVDVGAVSGSVLHDLRLRHVVVRTPDGQTAATLPEVDLRYSIFHLLGDRAHVERVRIERPIVDAERRQAFQLVSRGPTPNVTIEALRVDDGRVVAPSLDTSIEDLDARARIELGATSTGTLRALTAVLHRQGGTRPLAADGVARWSKQAVEVPGLELTSRQSRLRVRGHADRASAAGKVALTLEADLSADDLRALTSLRARQPLALELRARGTPAQLALDVRANLPAALGLGDRPLYGHAEVQRGDGRMAVAPLRLRAGANRLDAVVRRAGARSEVRLDDLVVTPALLRAVSSLDPTRTLRLSGTAAADAARVTARLRLGAGDGSARLDARLDRRTETLRAHLRSAALSPRALSARAPDGALTAAVAVAARIGGARRGGALRADVHGRLARQQIRRGALQARVTLGPARAGSSLLEAVERARLVADARVGPRRLRANLDAFRRGRIIRVPDAELELGRSRVALAGRWSPDRGALAWARAHLEPDDVHVLAPRLRPRADLDAHLTAAGPPHAVVARLDARLGAGQARALVALDVPAERATLRGELVDVDTGLLGEVRRVRLSAALSARGAREAEGWTLDELALRDGRVSWRGPHREPWSLESLALRGSARLGPRGHVRLQALSGIWVAPRRTRPVSARGEARWNGDRRIDLDAAFVAGPSSLAVSGFVGAAARLAARPLHLRTQLTVDAALLRELAPKIAAGRPLRVGLRAEGPLGALVVRGTATGLAGRSAALDARLHLADDDYVLRRLALRFGRSRLGASGRLARDRLRAGLDLSVTSDDAHRLVPVLEPSGPLSLRATAAGPLDGVGLRAVLTASKGRVHLGGRFDLPARRGRLRVTADGLAPRALKKDAVAGEISGALAVRGKAARGGVVGPLRVADVRGEVRGIGLSKGKAVGRLEGRRLVVTHFSIDVPGATSFGRARVSLDGPVDARIGVRVTDALALPAPFVAALALGADQALVSGSVVTVKLTRQKKDQKLKRNIDLILPGERALKKALGGKGE